MSLAISEMTPLEQLPRRVSPTFETPLSSMPWGEPPALGAWRKLAAKMSRPLTVGPSLTQLGALGSVPRALRESGSILGCSSGLGQPPRGIRVAQSQWDEVQKSILRNATVTVMFEGMIEPMTGMVTVPHHRVDINAMTGAGTLIADVKVAEPKSQSSAYAAFKQLGRWLILGDADLAVAIGVGRTTPYSWERDRHEPRPEIGRRLYQMHGTVSALVDQLGEAAATRWLAAGSPSPASLLRRGEVEEVNRLAHDLLFRPTHRRTLPGGFGAEEEADISPAALARAAHESLESE